MIAAIRLIWIRNKLIVRVQNVYIYILYLSLSEVGHGGLRGLFEP